METITFRCKSCATPLRVAADKAGGKARCKHCGAIVPIPARVADGREARPTAEDRTAKPEKPLQATGDSHEAVDQPEPTAAPRRKPPRRRRNINRAADLRTAAGWRKVRLGLYLIALSMCLVLLSIAATLIPPLNWVPVRYVVQALFLVGNLLCAFVPVKGPARNLALVNLGLIAFGMAMTIAAWRMIPTAFADSSREAGKAAEQAQARSTELVNKLRAVPAKEEQEWTTKLAELRKQAMAGDAEAAKEAEELSRKVAEARKKRMADQMEALKEATTGLTAGSTPSVSRMGRIWTWIWIHASGQWLLLQQSIQGIILAFFVQAVARSLGDKVLAARCLPVAVVSLVTLTLALLCQLVPATTQLIAFLLGGIIFVLGLVQFALLGRVLVEACAAIDDHIYG
jgi:hypothetical protein